MTPMRKITFTAEEFLTLIRLGAKLDPVDFKYPEARAVIEKCKATVDQVPIRVIVLSD